MELTAGTCLELNLFGIVPWFITKLERGDTNHTEESFPTHNDDKFFELYSIVVGRIVVQVIAFARHIII